MFAAKEAGEAGELCVTDLTLLEAGTRAYNYLMPQTDETLKLAGATGNEDAGHEYHARREAEPRKLHACTGGSFLSFREPLGQRFVEHTG